MNSKKYLTNGAVAFFALALLAFPVTAQADRHGRHHGRHHIYHYRDHPEFGLHLSFLPNRYLRIYLGGYPYYYYDGLYYYRDINGGYVLVPPPVGAVVRAIPPDFRPVVINGVTYYEDNGTYYVYTPNGYQVVPAPAAPAVNLPTATPAAPASPSTVAQGSTVPAGPVPVTIEPASPGTVESYNVSIPNGKGGSVVIPLKRNEKGGFTGPQGETYPSFPTVQQLKQRYAP